jgi:Holliday junction resolvase
MTKLFDMAERDVQRQVVDGLRLRGAYVIVTHGPKNRPVCPGVSDIVAVFPGRVLFVECKGEGGKVSEEQREFLSTMRALGHTAFVTDGWDDCERQI